MENDYGYEKLGRVFDGTSTEDKIDALKERNVHLKSNMPRLINEGEHPNNIFQEIDDNDKQIAAYRLDLHNYALKYWQQVNPDHPNCEDHSRKIAEQIKLLGHKPGKLERERVICWILKKSGISSVKIFELLDGSSVSQDAIYKKIKRWSDQGAVLVRTEPWLEYIYQDEASVVRFKICKAHSFLVCYGPLC